MVWIREGRRKHSDISSGSRLGPTTARIHFIFVNRNARSDPTIPFVAEPQPVQEPRVFRETTLCVEQKHKVVRPSVLSPSSDSNASPTS